MKTLFLCLAVVGIIGQAHADRRGILTALARSSVRVHLDGRPGYGSGAIIKTSKDDAWVLTCAHVVKDESGVLIDLDDEGESFKTFPALVEKVDRALDLALLHVLGKLDRPALPLALAMPPLYSTLYVVGSPLSIPRQAAEHILNTCDYGAQRRCTITGMVIPGMSGAPLVDEHERLVCVMQAVASIAGGPVLPVSGICVPLAHVRVFLKGYGL